MSRRDDEFREFVLSARSGLVRTATLLTGGDGHLAEDLVQTTLTRMYLAWSRIGDGPPRLAYARRALVNAMVDETRRPFRRRESSRSDVPDRPVDADFTVGVDAGLTNALARLPAGMRAAVVFRHVHQLSVTETADALNCSEGNVKSQTARGLERLRLALTEPRSEPSSPPVSDPEPARAGLPRTH